MKHMMFVLLSAVLISCNADDKSKFSTENLSDENTERLINLVIRYVGKIPSKAVDSTKFNAKFDKHYQKLSKQATLKLYLEKGEFEYLSIELPAVSIYEKKKAVAVKLKRKNNQLIYFEEVYRTWKMMPDELDKKSRLLFSEWVKGNDLTVYYPLNSGNEEYIQFPNTDTYYNTEQRKWISNREFTSVHRAIKPE